MAEIIPAIRTAADGALTYDAYLQTPEWRRRRNRALRDAGYRCQHCGRGRGLQVHHRTYERLGHEWDEDLEVLCDGCHRIHHFVEFQDEPSGPLYLKLVREAVRAEPFSTVADLAEASKRLCWRHGFRPDPRQIDRAVGLVCAGRSLEPPPVPARGERVDAGEVIGPREARELLARIGVRVGDASGPKRMPTVSRWELPDDEVRA